MRLFRTPFFSQFAIVTTLVCLSVFNNCSSYQSHKAVTDANAKGSALVSGNGDSYTGIGGGGTGTEVGVPGGAVDPFTGATVKPGVYHQLEDGVACDGSENGGLHVASILQIYDDSDVVLVTDPCSGEVLTTDKSELKTLRKIDENIVFDHRIFDFVGPNLDGQPPVISPATSGSQHTAVLCGTGDDQDVQLDFKITRSVEDELTLDVYGGVDEVRSHEDVPMIYSLSRDRIIFSNQVATAEVHIHIPEDVDRQKRFFFGTFRYYDPIDRETYDRPIACYMKLVVLNPFFDAFL